MQIRFKPAGLEDPAGFVFGAKRVYCGRALLGLIVDLSFNQARTLKAVRPS